LVNLGLFVWCYLTRHFLTPTWTLHSPMALYLLTTWSTARAGWFDRWRYFDNDKRSKHLTVLLEIVSYSTGPSIDSWQK